MARPLGRIAGTRTGSDATGPRLDGFYRWRDPARVGPQRRAQLEAHDRQYADPVRPPTAAGRHQAADSQAKQAAFAAARDRGLSIGDAAIEAGVAYGTGKRYEAMRRAEAVR